jgi:ribosomal protein S18 acetylase RimI-like enzyme
VLHSNHAAIAFYRRNGYTEVRRLDEFYYFNDAYHTAYLYVMYVNGYGPPLATRMWSGTRYLRVIMDI